MPTAGGVSTPYSMAVQVDCCCENALERRDESNAVQRQCTKHSGVASVIRWLSCRVEMRPMIGSVRIQALTASPDTKKIATQVLFLRDSAYVEEKGMF